MKVYGKEIVLLGGLASMGKTVPSYRMALEDEIGRWKNFRNGLPNEEEMQAFDVLMDMCRNLASASSCACKPIIFEPMAISILIAQQKKIKQLEQKLNELLMQRSGEQTRSNEPAVRGNF
ncbi:MAG: hypothetical protein ABSF65_09825 [Candidatus Bathyarchaeia archaeon]